MKDYSCENIRNICLLDMATRKDNAGRSNVKYHRATDRFGSVNDGNTVMDYDPGKKGNF